MSEKNPADDDSHPSIPRHHRRTDVLSEGVSGYWLIYSLDTKGTALSGRGLDVLHIAEWVFRSDARIRETMDRIFRTSGEVQHILCCLRTTYHLTAPH